MKATICYHCGLTVPDAVDYSVAIKGKVQPMCCLGCQAVAMAIVDGGLDSFYSYRETINQSGSNQSGSNQSSSNQSESNQSDTRDYVNKLPISINKLAIDEWKIYDLPDVQQEFVTTFSNEESNKESNHQESAQESQAQLVLEGVTCAACTWLVEHHLQKNPAVKQVSLNVSTHRCSVVWNPQIAPLSEIMLSLASIGYLPRPATDDNEHALYKKENRTALFRLGVAGFGMMQAMMVAVGIYFGATDEWLNFLRWLSLLVATPVVFFSAAPFFQAANKSIQARQLTMDVPVALAIGLTYIASAWATLRGGGEVYFESVSMFTFFLLLGRHIEMRARHRNRIAFGTLAQLMPLTACCITQQSGKEIQQAIPLKRLALQDLVLVKAGETFPCDGLIERGETEIVEALITGESIPVQKGVGQKVIAGTLNNHSPVYVRVTAIGGDTTLSAIEKMSARAQQEKPKQILFADKVARFFIGRLLVVCIGVFIFWWFKDPSRAFWISLSVLVVTCPCALALAMPAAHSAATAALRKKGLLITRAQVLETLAKVNHIIFDKTGTLSQGKIHITDVHLCGSLNRKLVLEIAAALEAGAHHPIADAFIEWQQKKVAVDLRQVTAGGVSGVVDSIAYRFGHQAFAQEIISKKLVQNWKDKSDKNFLSAPDNKKLWLMLAHEQGVLAWIGFEDQVRKDAPQTITEIKALDIEVELLSGDHSGSVADMALVCGIENFLAGTKPEEKLERLSIAQLRGDVVMMVGDGINDVPVLSGADVSIAMAGASDLAQTRADAILLNNQLSVLPESIRIAKKTQSIIRQNLTFSLLYNLLALPLAATGHVAPWAAATGMTASSLVVVFNSMRLNRNN